MTKPRRKSGRRIPVWIRVPVLILLGLHAFWAVCLLGLRFINPITTGVQVQRRVEALLSWSDYTKRSTFVPLERISTHLQHAVIAAEDGRFYQHSGIDWQQVEIVMQESIEEGEIPRGASTITQQLVKNLFFTTHRNPFRKVFEYTLAPMASVILGQAARVGVVSERRRVGAWGVGCGGCCGVPLWVAREPIDARSIDAAGGVPTESTAAASGGDEPVQFHNRNADAATGMVKRSLFLIALTEPGCIAPGGSLAIVRCSFAPSQSRKR